MTSQGSQVQSLLRPPFPSHGRTTASCRRRRNPRGDLTGPAPTLGAMTLTHLQRLEAESIHILREVVAQAERPVMLYSVGKDSAVLLHLALKAFHPAPPPFPLLHVDTTWKFRAMYELRDRAAAAAGMELIVHRNPDALARGINPFDHGALHTDLWKTEGLKQALDAGRSTRPLPARGATRRRAGPRSASFPSAPPPMAGTPRPSGRSCGTFTTRATDGRVGARLPAVRLDRARHLAIHPGRGIEVVPLYLSARRPTVERERTDPDGGRRPLSAGAGRGAGRTLDPLPHPRLLPAHRRGGVRSAHLA